MQGPTPEQIRQKLRAVAWPGFDQDVVAAGFVKEIDVRDGTVLIGFQARTRRTDKVATMEEGIRQVLCAMPEVERVEIRRIEPAIDPVLSRGGREMPLQVEAAADGGTQGSDPMLGVVDSGAELGPRWDGKRPGRGGRDSTTYRGALPVTQWDIDPTDPKARSGEAHITLDDWEYRMWWQVHPSDLAYVSIQAVLDDTVSHGRAARAHSGRDPSRTRVFRLRRAWGGQ